MPPARDPYPPTSGQGQPASARHVLHRRNFLGLLGAASLFGAAACGSGSEEPTTRGTRTTTAQAKAAGPFNYTDARGVTVRLDEVPKTVVAQSSAAASLLDAGYQVAGVYGELGTKNGKLDYQAGSLDLSKVTVLGKTYGDFSIERYAALQPDLLVDQSMDSKTLWYIPPEASKQIYALAPAVGMKMLGLSLPPIIEQFVDLARMLGADPETPALRTAKADFDDAVAEVRAAVAAKPGLRVLVVSRDPDNAFLGNPVDHPDLKHLWSLGVGFVDSKTKPGTYFQQISWEQVGAYPADVIVYDARELPKIAEAVQAIGTWTALPAVKAGQVYPWHPAAPYSYRTYAPLYRDVARWLKSSRPLAT